jgi:DNA-binding XRE family transcriptional regulator
MLRHGNRLTQAQMALKIGCNRATYAAIEKGTRNGNGMFWNALQKAFEITDTDVGKLKKLTK